MYISENKDIDESCPLKSETSNDSFIDFGYGANVPCDSVRLQNLMIKRITVVKWPWGNIKSP